MEFVVVLCVFACGAGFWGLFAVVYVSAVSASPFDFGVAFEDVAVFDVFMEFLVSFFVLFFDFCDFLEGFGYLWESFLLCCLLELGV